MCRPVGRAHEPKPRQRPHHPGGTGLCGRQRRSSVAPTVVAPVDLCPVRRGGPGWAFVERATPQALAGHWVGVCVFFGLGPGVCVGGLACRLACRTTAGAGFGGARPERGWRGFGPAPAHRGQPAFSLGHRVGAFTRPACGCSPRSAVGLVCRALGPPRPCQHSCFTGRRTLAHGGALEATPRPSQPPWF